MWYAVTLLSVLRFQPAAVEELRRWTSDEALGDMTVTTDCMNRIAPNVTLATVTDGETTDGGGTIGSDDEGIDHKLPSPEEQLQVIALKYGFATSGAIGRCGNERVFAGFQQKSWRSMCRGRVSIGCPYRGGL